MDCDFWMLSQDVISYRLAQIPSKLLAWYDAGNRKLPWRNEPTPYRVWVSEVMLQQTRVQAVLPYFERFIQQLPDVFALASVEDDDLMKLWEGLGYYSRARNLKHAARVIVEEMHGVIPSTAAQLQKLPGIGEYTAGAIASIAFGEAIPAVDGNVLRVIARVFRNEEDILCAKAKRQYQKLLHEMMPDRPGDFNQALMELGAVLCLPNGAPQCQQCPLASICIAHQEGCEKMLPVKAPKAKRAVQERNLTLLICNDTVLIKKRPKSGILAGLWEFYEVTNPTEAGFHVCGEVELPQAKHIFSHVEWRMKAKAFYVSKAIPIADGIWANLSQIQEQYAIPSAYRTYIKLLPELLS